MQLPFRKRSACVQLSFNLPSDSVLAEFSNVQREKVRVVEHSYAVIDCEPPNYNPGALQLGRKMNKVAVINDTVIGTLASVTTSSVTVLGVLTALYREQLHVQSGQLDKLTLNVKGVGPIYIKRMRNWY